MVRGVGSCAKLAGGQDADGFRGGMVGWARCDAGAYRVVCSLRLTAVRVNGQSPYPTQGSSRVGSSSLTAVDGGDLVRERPGGRIPDGGANYLRWVLDETA